MLRAAGIPLERGMQRIASAQEFRCIDAVIRVEAEAACLDGALERAAGDAEAACGIRDGELGHGWALRFRPEVVIQHLLRGPGTRGGKGRARQAGFVGGIEPCQRIPARQQACDLVL